MQPRENRFGHRFYSPASTSRAVDRYRKNDKRGKVGLSGIVGLIPFQKPEDEIQHICAGFLNSGLRSARNFPAHGIERFLVMQHREALGILVFGLVKIERGIPA